MVNVNDQLLVNFVGLKQMVLQNLIILNSSN